jgi:hypothetical protein
VSWYERLGWRPGDEGPVFKAFTAVLHDFREAVLQVSEKHHLTPWEMAFFLMLMSQDTSEYLLLGLEVDDNLQRRTRGVGKDQRGPSGD